MESPVLFIGRKLSRATRQWLRKQQIEFNEQTFRRIVYKKPNLAFFNTMARKQKQWVVTSVYSAHWLYRFRNFIGITQTDSIFCWSEKQAEVLYRLGLPIHISPYNDQKALADLVSENNEGESVIFLRGNKLHTELTSLWRNSNLQYNEVEVYKNTPVERFVSGMYDAYLFFSPTAIEDYKAAGNFPQPNAPVLAAENSTARTAWKVFPNKVWVSPEEEELSFVKYAVDRLEREKKEENERHSTFFLDY
jgi:uroporphyrinogen-III synthase